MAQKKRPAKKSGNKVTTRKTRKDRAQKTTVRPPAPTSREQGTPLSNRSVGAEGPI